MVFNTVVFCVTLLDIEFLLGGTEIRVTATDLPSFSLTWVLKPKYIDKEHKNIEFSIDCHVDADFAGLYNVEDVMDPSCVKSRTGFVISIRGCPVVWTSKLQSDIATSTMEAEYNALSMAMKDLLPFRNIFQAVGTGTSIDSNVATTFRTTVWEEDNMGCLRLARQRPGQYTPLSKHYAVKYHWFRSHLSDAANRTTVEYIETELQKADILTKGLTAETFCRQRLLLCGS